MTPLDKLIADVSEVARRNGVNAASLDFAALHAELVRLREDAERYRIVRDLWNHGFRVRLLFDNAPLLVEKKLDAAIDRARTASQVPHD
jgi:hypothetical protein